MLALKFSSLHSICVIVIVKHVSCFAILLGQMVATKVAYSDSTNLIQPSLLYDQLDHPVVTIRNVRAKTVVISLSLSLHCFRDGSSFVQCSVYLIKLHTFKGKTNDQLLYYILNLDNKD